MRPLLIIFPIALALHAQAWTDLGSGSLLSPTSPQNCNNSGPAYCTANGGIVYDYPSHFPALLTAWGGGIARTKAGSEQFVFFGGGHTDYLGNDIHTVNLNVSPVTASMLTTPSVIDSSGHPATVSPDNIVCTQPNPDGSPLAQHSYQNSTYIPDYDELFFWAQGASTYCLGYAGTNPDRRTFTFRFSNNSWHDMAPTGFDVQAGSNGGATGANVVYDPATKKVFVLWGLGALGELLQYDRGANTWAQLLPFGTGNWPAGGYAAIDPVRRLLVTIGTTSSTSIASLQAVKIDISGSPWTVTDITGSLSGCSAANVIGPGMAYDPHTGNFKIYPGSGNDVLDFDPVTAKCTTITATGGPTNAAPGAGEWGKWQYFPTLNKFYAASLVTNDVFSWQISPTSPASLHGLGASTYVCIDHDGDGYGTGATRTGPFTDLVIDGSNAAKVTSASYTFTAYDVWRAVRITGGSGFTAGTYRINSVTGGAAILSANVGTTGSTGGSWVIDGCLGVDSDDLDYTVHTGAELVSKYGTLSAGLAHLGYTPLRTWYISTTGNDTTCISGTAPVGIGSPCLNFSTVINTHLVAGDMIIWRGGTYSAATQFVSLPPTNGTMSNPIIFMGYPGEKIKFDLSVPVSHPPGFQILDNSWYVIDGFELTGSGAGAISGGNGSWFGSSFHDITVRHVETHHSYWGYLAGGFDNLLLEDYVGHDMTNEHSIYWGAEGNVSTNSTIRWTISYNNPQNGIHINNNISGLVMEQNIAYANGIANFDWQNGIHDSFFRSNLSFLGGSSGDFNVSLYPGTEGITVANQGGNFACGVAKDETCVCEPTGNTYSICAHDMQNNVIENNTLMSGSGNFVDGSQLGPVSVYVNRSVFCDPAGTSATSTTIGTGSKTFTTQAGLTQANLAYTVGSFLRVYSSANHANYMQGTVTAYSGTSMTINITAISGSGTFTDWLITSTPACLDSQIGSNTFRNLIGDIYSAIGATYPPLRYQDGTTGWPQSSTYNSLVMWQSDASHRPGVMLYGATSYSCGSPPSGVTLTNCVNADPLFTTSDPTAYLTPTLFDFHLQSTSPAIHTGTATGAPAYDLYGNAFAGTPSMGALEFQGSSTTPASALSGASKISGASSVH